MPLSIERHNIEWEYIIHTADVNGYDESLMIRLFKRHTRRLLIKNSTTFTPERNKKVRFGVHFHPSLTPSLQKACNQLDLHIVPSSNNFKVKCLLGSTKDKITNNNKAGVYQFTCPYTNCNAKYIGETSRALDVRATEHIRSTKNNHPELSAVAEHAIECGHTGIDKSDFKLISSISNKIRLRVYESIHIHKNNENLINRDAGAIPNSCLFDLL